MSASAEGTVSTERRGLGVLPASERPLKTATSLLEPVRVDVGEDRAGRRTPPGLTARDALHGGVAVSDEGRRLGDGRRPDLENCKHKGGWQGCELCGRSTTQRCSQCRAVVCKNCYQEHLEERCRMSDFRLCAVCGTARCTSPCDRCGTSFCDRHSEHDCPTPRSGDRGFGRESGLSIVRRELEHGLAESELVGRSRPKVSVRVDAPGDWDRREAVRLSLAAADEESWRMRQLGGPQFMSGQRADPSPVPIAVGGRNLVVIPMA